MSSYEKIAKLPLQIDTYKLKLLKKRVTGGIHRHTTIIKFAGAGKIGEGEDVTYDPKDQLAFQKYGPTLNFKGTYTLDEFSKKVGKLDLFKPAPKPYGKAFRLYRRWAFESAALSLALMQNQTTLAKILDRKLRPLTFVVSPRLGEPSATKPLQAWLKLYPKMRIKIDSSKDWNDNFINELAALKVVDTVDLKGQYKGMPQAPRTNPHLYKRVVNGFPKAWIEDPDITKSTWPILQSHKDRITWDSPLHSLKDVKDLSFKPRTINIKPSRFGSLQELFSVYDYCAANKINMYGGGQFELGIGRHQIQYLAALFHPGTPNDVAPGGYNSPKPLRGLPKSPLQIKEPF